MRRVLAFGVVAMILASGSATAQETDAPAAEQAATDQSPGPDEQHLTPKSPILVIRQSALFTQSSAAKSIASQAAAAQAKLDAELDKVGESLRERERELSEQRASLPKGEFDTLAAAFERDVRAFYARSQRERGLVDQAVGRARADLRRGAESVLIQIMRRHSALVMLDEEQVVLSVNSLDITQEAIDGLDQIIPDISLELSSAEELDQP